MLTSHVGFAANIAGGTVASAAQGLQERLHMSYKANAGRLSERQLHDLAAK